MPRIAYLASALRDLDKIAQDIEIASRNQAVALTFIDKLTDYCEPIAMLTGLLGRSRHELRSEYRSITFGSYVIFFRYIDGDKPREIMQIIHIVYGARDMEAFFHNTTE